MHFALFSMNSPLSPLSRSRSYDALRCSSPRRRLAALSAVVDSASSPPSSKLQAPLIIKEKAQLESYIATGPLLESTGLSSRNSEEWLAAGARLAVQMEMPEDPTLLSDAQRLRIYHYYIPVYFWCRAQIEAHKATGSKQALVLGISAPQGCGKSTLVEQLEQLFTWQGIKAGSVSIDDFYLDYKGQCSLSEANPGNKILQFRGNAGTHDLELGTRTLKSLRDLSLSTSDPPVATIPRYDKSIYAGRGDRAPESRWTQVEGPLDVILFEGWMSGFRPLGEARVKGVDPDLVKVDQCLQGYEEAWDSFVDSWLVVKIGDPQWVFKWRLQAEERMRASGKSGMTDAQISDFVSRFMPAYKAYLPELYSKGPTTSRKGKTLIIEVDADRSPVKNQPKQ